MRIKEIGQYFLQIMNMTVASLLSLNLNAKICNKKTAYEANSLTV